MVIYLSSLLLLNLRIIISPILKIKDEEKVHNENDNKIQVHNL